NTLSVVKINDRTRHLLERSQEQAEQMQAQEEEMRQNMEELLATQEEMARKEQEMSVKMEAISGLALLMEYDFNGNILSVNQKLCSTTGYTKEELINRNHSVLISNGNYAGVETDANFWSMMRNNQPFEGNFKRKSKDGNVISIKGYVYPIFDEEGMPLKVIEIGVIINEFAQQ
ncbi:MAG: PAS domain-containing protein, partial [Salinivirgaceae bacterium]|nr:PAS domain-containing protein [Salinivirgaceae bacterium]